MNELIALKNWQKLKMIPVKKFIYNSSRLFPVVPREAGVKWLRLRLSIERLDVSGPHWSALVVAWGNITQPRKITKKNSQGFNLQEGVYHDITFRLYDINERVDCFAKIISFFRLDSISDHERFQSFWIFIMLKIMTVFQNTICVINFLKFLSAKLRFMIKPEKKTRTEFSSRRTERYSTTFKTNNIE